ncbi:MAG: UDP-N-acetylglucosamine 2-epimerase (non-hydrolyzing) [Deltaproteobacteria bacterium]|nr:UDP-N-acetylglucosamine 2-epimerase (non-hydrolyzing) [Deltaproteobacteria bacterium]
MKKKISFIFGTRPEAIKLSPLILALKKYPEIETHVCVTGQHRQLLDQVLEVFGVIPDVDLALMQPDQTLGGLTSRAIAAIDAYLSNYKPDMVLVQGDTTTVFCAALCAFYYKIPVGHVEAGLRTWNKYSPFPEETNRVLATHLSTLHFAPTANSRNNLIKEGIEPTRIYVTGNTVIDALYLALDKVTANPPAISNLPDQIMVNGQQLILITGHRRENFGEGFRSICRAIKKLANQFPEATFVYPVHLNPNVQGPVFNLLGNGKNIHLIQPLSYLPFVALMNRSTVILTDSGGIQEEAPSLGKPVLVMREETERPEAVEMGTVKLVGTDEAAIFEETSTLLTDDKAYHAMANAVNPYGDGKATDRIISTCLKFIHEEGRCD